MENLMSFDNPEFGTVRSIIIDNEPWFVLKDVCAVFGEQNYRRVANNIDEEDKGVSQIATLGGNQGMITVNESGLYAALFNMKPKKARGVTQEYIDKRVEELKAFKRWVTHDILPSVRKNGGYIAGQEQLSPQELMAKALLVANKTLEERELRIANLNKQVEAQTKEIECMKPKVTYYDKILNSKSLVSVTEIAKDYGFGAVTLNRILNQKKVQYKVNGTWVLYEKYQNKGYVGTKTASFSSSDGYDCSRESTYWTQKGRMFIYDLLKKDGMIPVMEREENQ